MKNEVAALRFDYSVVDDDSRRMLISHAGDINRQKGIGLKAMLAMGETIGQAHDLLANHGNGLFGKWVEAECGISQRSAFRYLNAHKAFGKDCDSLSQTSTAEALYALSAPGAPPEAVKKAKKLAEKGIKVTEKIAKELVKPKEEEPEAEPAATDFDPAAFKKAKPGTQKRKPADRKMALQFLGKLVRALDKLGLSGDLDSELKAINQALKAS